MKITSNVRDGYYVDVEFEVTPEEFNAQVEKVYHRRKGSINIPGFRKGKATRSMIERTYGKEVFTGDAVNELFTALSPDVEAELGLEPLEINPDTEGVDASGGLTYKVRYTVEPDVIVGEYKSIALTVGKHEVTDKDVEDEIERQRRKTARIVDVSDAYRAAKKGDIVFFDFEGTIDDKLFEGGSAENYKLELGSKRFIEGFEEQIEGHKIGDEFDVNVTFPEDYSKEDIAGKPALFECKLNAIQEYVLDDFDDEFVKDVSELETVAEFTAELRERLELRAAEARKSDLSNKCNEVVATLCTGDLPRIMIEREIDRLAVDMARSYETQGVNFMALLKHMGKTVADFRADLTEGAEEFVRCRLAYKKIAAIENLALTEEEVEERYKSLAELAKLTVDEVKAKANDKGMREDMLCQKAQDLVTDSAVITVSDEVPDSAA
ncbi:trigger factor [Clostridia bacterium]|nr:trigger factor [Clostridia bacterium]